MTTDKTPDMTEWGWRRLYVYVPDECLALADDDGNPDGDVYRKALSDLEDRLELALDAVAENVRDTFAHRFGGYLMIKIED